MVICLNDFSLTSNIKVKDTVRFPVETPCCQCQVPCGQPTIKRKYKNKLADHPFLHFVSPFPIILFLMICRKKRVMRSRLQDSRGAVKRLTGEKLRLSAKGE